MSSTRGGTLPFRNIRVVVDCLSIPAEMSEYALLAYNEHVANLYRAGWSAAKDIRVVQYDGPTRESDSVVTILDDGLKANVLGYHDMFNDGVPYARVFADRCTRSLVPLSVVVSHEIADMIVNPTGNLAAVDASGRTWALEVSDAVETLWYKSDKGVPLSNFVTPLFFLPRADKIPNARFDFMGKIDAPFHVAPGGYRQIQTLLGWRAERF